MNTDFFSLGQSGDKIGIISAGKSQVVRKETSKSGSSRLQLQYRKHQLALENSAMSPFEVPAIIEHYNKAGYSMELAHGLPLGEALNKMSNSESVAVLDKFNNYFSRLHSESLGAEEVPPSQILGKLEDLKEKYRFLEDPAFSKISLRALSELESFFSNSPIPKSWNHGDFSFENILVSKKAGTLYVVDFLDSPFDSFWLDIGRIWLDLSFPWWGSGFRQPAISRLNQVTIKEGIYSELGTHGFDGFSLDLLACFSALRILPYTSNPVRKANLKLAVRNIVLSDKKRMY